MSKFPAISRTHWLAPSLLVAACYTGADGDSATGIEPMPLTETSATVELRILSDARLPVASARVTVADAVHRSDLAGHLRLAGNRPGRFVARVEAPGFAPASAVLELRPGAAVVAEVVMLPLGEAVRFTAGVGVDVIRDGVRVRIPGDAVADPQRDGVALAADAEVELTIVVIDPTRRLWTMPGPLVGRSAAGRRVALESRGMVEISLYRGGERLKLRRPIELEVELPPAVVERERHVVGGSVAAWWFDHERGEWIEEGRGVLGKSTMTPRGLSWQTQLAHLTWWNSDVPLDESCVLVTVLDKLNQAPVPDVQVVVAGTNYEGASIGYTDADGEVCLGMKLGPGTEADIYVGSFGDPVSEVLHVVNPDDTPSACGVDKCDEHQLILDPPLCELGETLLCDYSGPDGTAGQGECQAPVRSCTKEHVFSAQCLGEVTPVVEACGNAKDDDCDGWTDESGECACDDPNAPPPAPDCYTGDAATIGVGICHTGTWQCQIPVWKCVGQQLPEVEDPNTIEDEDCDGIPAKLNAEVLQIAGDDYQIASDLALVGNQVVAVGAFAGDTELAKQALTDPQRQGWLAQMGKDLQPAGPDDVYAVVTNVPQNEVTRLALAVTPDDRVVVAGMCAGQLDLGGLVRECGPRALFVARFAAGSVTVADWLAVFSELAAAPTKTQLGDLAVLGDVAYVLGEYDGDPVLHVNGLVLQYPSEEQDLFVAGVPIGGGDELLQSFTTIGGPAFDSASAVIVDQGELVVAGKSFGPHTVCPQEMVSGGDDDGDAFVTRLDAQMLQCAGTTTWFTGAGAQTVYALGSFQGAWAVGFSEGNVMSDGKLLQGGDGQIFVGGPGKLAGLPVYGDATHLSWPAAVLPSPAGPVVVTSFVGKLGCGQQQWDSQGGSDLAIVRLDPVTLACTAGLHLPGELETYAAVRDAKHVIVAGQFHDELDFGGTVFNNNNDDPDGFVLRVLAP